MDVSRGRALDHRLAGQVRDPPFIHPAHHTMTHSTGSSLSGQHLQLYGRAHSPICHGVMQGQVNAPRYWTHAHSASSAEWSCTPAPAPLPLMPLLFCACTYQEFPSQLSLPVTPVTRSSPSLPPRHPLFALHGATPPACSSPQLANACIVFPQAHMRLRLRPSHRPMRSTTAPAVLNASHAQARGPRGEITRAYTTPTDTPLAPGLRPPGSPPPAGPAAPSWPPAIGCRTNCGCEAHSVHAVERAGVRQHASGCSGGFRKLAEPASLGGRAGGGPGTTGKTSSTTVICRQSSARPAVPIHVCRPSTPATPHDMAVAVAHTCSRVQEARRGSRLPSSPTAEPRCAHQRT